MAPVLSFKSLALSFIPGLFSLAASTTYDYIIIGGGTGGLTVASRLAENTALKVLVIEAGPYAEDLPEVFIPGLIGTGQSLTTLNWAYRTTPQANLNNRQVTVNAGKALGGSTIINSVIFPRAQKEQYDTWSALNGNSPSWTWSALLPYFKKSELFTPPNAFQSSVGGARFLPDFHGSQNSPTGRIKVGFPNFFYPQSKLWREASGMTPSPDLGNGEVIHEVGVAPDSIDAANNTRCSAACAYYVPFRDQPNFTVLTNSTVTRIIWGARSTNSEPLVAVAVEYISPDGTITSSNVRKEVIVSAGTIGSPKIMELSGVGNATILKAAGVEPVLDLPTVGENLADHVHSWANAFTNITLTKDALLLNTAFADQQRALWFQNRTGLYSAVPRSLSIVSPFDIFAPAQFGSVLSAARANLTFYSKQFSNGNAKLQKGIEAQHTMMLDLFQKGKAGVLEVNLEPGYSGPTPFSTRPPRNYTTINAVFYYPLSRGRTHITSSSPTTPPLVDPAYYSHPLDVAAHVAGIQLARKQLKTPPLLGIYQGEFEPGVGPDNAAVEQWARGVVASDNHEVGSMAMMPQELGGVVDTELRVYGLKNVRVADASVIPVPISAHLESSVYMIGERAADFIKNA